MQPTIKMFELSNSLHFINCGRGVSDVDHQYAKIQISKMYFSKSRLVENETSLKIGGEKSGKEAATIWVQLFNSTEIKILGLFGTSQNIPGITIVQLINFKKWSVLFALMLSIQQIACHH